MTIYLNRTLGLRKSFLNQTTYVLKFWLLQQSFLNRDSFLNRSFLNQDFSVFVTNSLLLFSSAVAILCNVCYPLSPILSKAIFFYSDIVRQLSSNSKAVIRQLAVVRQS